MSLAPSIAFAFLGAALFGAATSVTLTCAMSAVQELLPDERRVLGFAAFHVLIRIGLSVSAIAAGIAGDLLTGHRWPVVGELPPSRMVLLVAGLVVLGGAALLAPLLRRERFATPTVAPAAASGGVQAVPVQQQSEQERSADGRRGSGALPVEALDQHGYHDDRRRDRRPAASQPVQQWDDGQVGDEATHRGLARPDGRGPGRRGG